METTTNSHGRTPPPAGRGAGLTRSAIHEEVVRPTGLIGRLATCVARDVTGRDVRNIRRWGISMVAWAVASLVEPSWLGGVEGETSVVTVLLGLTVLGTLLGVLLSFARYLRETDELNRSIQYRSIGWAFAAGFVATIAAEATMKAGLAETVDVDLPLLAMLVTYAIASVRITASYR